MDVKFLLVSVANGEEFALADGDSYTIGRNEDCDLVVSEGYPSRQHARISVKEGQVVLEDLGSTNGTYVNKRQIDTPTTIKPGDVIAVPEYYGRVDSLGARYVSVTTRDGIEHLIPNEELITTRVENWSSFRFKSHSSRSACVR